MINSSIVNSVSSPIHGLNRFGGLTLPGRDQLAALFVERDGVMTDIIGGSSITRLSPCGTSDGSSYISIASIVGTETAINGGTATPTVSSGKITFGAGTIFNVRLSSGIILPVCEGSGTITYGYDSDGNVHVGTITASDIFTFWGAPQSTFHHAFDNGFSERENACLHSNNIANDAWTKSTGATATLDAVGIGGSANTASTISDSNASGFSYVQQTLSLGVGAKTHTFVVWVKKDSDTVRWPGIQINYTGGTAKSASININTRTGEITLVAGGPLTRVESHGDWWKFFISLQANASNTGHNIKIWPAVGTSDTTQDSNAVGSCVIGNVEVHQNKSIDEASLIDAPITTDTAFSGKQPYNPITGLDVLGNNIQYSAKSNRAIKISLPYSSALGEIDDGTFFAGETPNVVGYEKLIKLRGPKWFFADRKHLVAYSSDQVGSVLARIKNLSSIPSYLPAGATFHADFIDSKFFWRDREQSLANLQDSNGIKFLDYGFDFTGNTFLIIDYEIDQSGSPDGALFSWTSEYPGGDRFEIYPYTNGIDIGMRFYLSPPSVYEPFDLSSKIGEATAHGSGIHRLVVKINNDSLVKYQPDNGVYREGVTAPSSLVAPTRIGIGCVTFAPGAPTFAGVDITIRRLSLINKDISDAYVTELGKSGSRYPIHIIGDSFANSNWMRNALMVLTSPYGYIGYSQDGVGSTSLAQQAVRFAENDPKWHDSTLIIYEGGLDGSGEDAVTAIQSMINNLNHSRWIYLQSAPNISYVLGSEQREIWEGKEAIIKEFCGSNYVETLTYMQSEGDDSPEDNAEIAKGLWPLSLKSSESDFHPSSLGQQKIAELVKTELMRRGWL